MLADLEARHRATAEAVDALEDACLNRGWWAEQWPEGRVYVAGLVALAAPEAKIMPLRVLDPQGVGNTWVIAEAIRYALDPDGLAAVGSLVARFVRP